MQIPVRLPNLLAFAFLFYNTQLAAADISVAATIRPLQAIAQAIMQDHGTVSALISLQDSPHDYALTPGDRLAIEKADLLFWAGPEFEIRLSDVFQANIGRKRVLAATEVPGLTIHQGNDGRGDPHFWLNTHNALLIAHELVGYLSEIEPNHGRSFQSGYRDFERQISKLEKTIDESLSPFADVPFLVFHDAFQYFEKQFNLTAGEVLLRDPEILPSMRELLTIRHRVQRLPANCVLMDRRANKELVSTIFANDAPSLEIVDLFGFQVKDSAKAYLDIASGVADSFHACLTQE